MNNKVRISIAASYQVEQLPPGMYHFSGILNPADLSQEIKLSQYDLINIAPVPLLQQVQFEGSAWKVGDWRVPAELCFMGCYNNHSFL